METTTYVLLREGKEWQSYDEGLKVCLCEYERQSGYTTKIIKKDKKQAKMKCFIGTCSFSFFLTAERRTKFRTQSQFLVTKKSIEIGL